MTEATTVSCVVCGSEEAFDSLGAARAAVERHRVETGHEVTWELGTLAAGVERAGDGAGVCGRPACTTMESPLYQGE